MGKGKNMESGQWTGMLEKTKREIPELLKSHGYECTEVILINGVDIAGPENASFILVVATDDERDRIKGVKMAIREKLAQAGYPTDAVSKIGIDCESQQTVDRDWNGSWWQRLK